MYNAEFWFNVTDPKSGRFIMGEKWDDDTTKYIKALKDKAPNKQTKTYLDGLLKHLGKEGFLSDDQKSSLANITKETKGGSSKSSEDKSSESKKDTPKEKSKSDVKDTPKEKSKSDVKDTYSKKSDKYGQTNKEIKKQVGVLLGKMGNVGKDLGSKVDAKAVEAIEKGVAGGANVKDATASVLDKLKDEHLEKKKEKELDKKKKEELKKVQDAKKSSTTKPSTKKESFQSRFRDYLI